jgi:hypothetical protein
MSDQPFGDQHSLNAAHPTPVLEDSDDVQARPIRRSKRARSPSSSPEPSHDDEDTEGEYEVEGIVAHGRKDVSTSSWSCFQQTLIYIL